MHWLIPPGRLFGASPASREGLRVFSNVKVEGFPASGGFGLTAPRRHSRADGDRLLRKCCGIGGTTGHWECDRCPLGYLSAPRDGSRSPLRVWISSFGRLGALIAASALQLRSQAPPSAAGRTGPDNREAFRGFSDRKTEGSFASGEEANPSFQALSGARKAGDLSVLTVFGPRFDRIVSGLGSRSFALRRQDRSKRDAKAESLNATAFRQGGLGIGFRIET